MALDLSKYGVTPIEEKQSSGNILPDGRINLSKYDVRQAVANPLPEPRPSLIKRTLNKVSDFASDISKQKLGASVVSLDAQGKPTFKKEIAEKIVSDTLGFTGGSGAIKALKSKTINILKNTPETLSKIEEAFASKAGRIGENKITGIKTIAPSKTEIRASEILEGQLSSVTKNPQIIDKEIARRGQEVEKFLAKNKLPVTAQEQADMFKSARKEMELYSTKTELKAYDEQMRTFLKQLPGRGGYTTDNFYKALKAFEDNATRNLPKGKTALIGDFQGIGSARIRAAKDIREVVRTMLGNKHPQFKGKMFDLASLYDVLDTALTKSRQLSGNYLTRLAKKNPFITGAVISGGLGLAGKKLFGSSGNNNQQTNYNPGYGGER